MKEDDLVRMVNQIADFFAPYGEAEAAEGVADHLLKFWDPRMRAQFLDLSPQAQAGLKPAARSARNRLAAPAG